MRPVTFGSLFLSTPSARRATFLACFVAVLVTISIHALREEGDTATPSGASASIDFYPRPPRGGRLFSWLLPLSARQFLSTPSARRATFCSVHLAGFAVISIHALREEGDRSTRSPRRSHGNFYPRPPRGGRRISITLSSQTWAFLSTPSARRATGASYWPEMDLMISIHALREEGDLIRGGLKDATDEFLSTPSARRATLLKPVRYSSFLNFYPRPPRGGRPRLIVRRLIPSRFLSTPSARRATTSAAARKLHERFLSTPSARRATCCRGRPRLGRRYFYPRPPRGGRPMRSIF